MNIEEWKQRKKDLHLTYDDLSQMTGLARKTIVNFFSKSTEPRKETVYAIGEALGLKAITPEELAAGASVTRKENITPLEDELLYQFRLLKKNHGEETQRAVVTMITNMNQK